MPCLAICRIAKVCIWAKIPLAMLSKLESAGQKNEIK
nr:MAG TPA: hypothetical protein [Caudoviricetes sp.]